jgi:hypothetical protein
MSLIQAEKYQRAEKLLRRILKKEPKNGLYWFNLGSLYLVLEKHKNASISFRRAAIYSDKMKVPALLFQAKSLNELKRHKAALRVLLKLKKLDLTENIALEVDDEIKIARSQRVIRTSMNYYLKREYRRSISQLQRYDNLQEDPTALKLLAFNYIRLKDFDEARRVIKRIRQLAKSKEEKKMTLNFLGQLKDLKTEYEQRDNLYLDFSLGYDSNFFTSDENTSKDSFSYRLSSTYEKRLREKHDSNISLYVGVDSQSTFSELKDDNISGYLISPSFQFMNGKNEYKIRPFFSHQFSELTSLMTQPGINLSYIKTSFFRYWGLESDHTKNIVIDDNFSYLEGWLHSIRWFRVNQKGIDRIEYFIKLMFERTRDIEFSDQKIPESNDGAGVGVSYQRALGSRWTVEAGGSYEFRKFHEKALPSMIERKDHTLTGYGKLYFMLSDRSSFYMLAQSALNRSNLDEKTDMDQNYKQFLVFMGVTWGIPL